MSAIILGGGRSSRLGQDKITLETAGENLLCRTLDKLGHLEKDIILVLAQGQSIPKICFSQKVKIVTDIHIGKGPLVGIYSEIQASSEDYSVVAACDMPFLNIDLLRYMTGLISGFDMVIPRIGCLVEPLHAVYSKNYLPKMEIMVKKDILKIDDLLTQVDVRYVEDDEIEAFDREHLSFFNINTPSDLGKASEIINQEREGANR